MRQSGGSPVCGSLRKEYAAKQGQIESVNTALGGDWWQELARAEPEGWVEQVLLGYATRVGKAAGCGFITADVADSLEAQPGADRADRGDGGDQRRPDGER
jgi:hypothetical protein